MDALLFLPQVEGPVFVRIGAGDENAERRPSDVPSKIPATSASRSARPSASSRSYLAHRRGFLVPGQLAPLGVMPGGAGELRDEDPVTIRARAVVGHVPKCR